MQTQSSTYKTDSIWHPTRTRLMRPRHSPTPSRANRPRSGRRALKAPRLPTRQRILPSTSASTRRCCTTPSTATLARCTLVTCTDSLSSCTKYSVTPRMKTALLFSGATPTRGVRTLRLCSLRAAVNMPRSRQRCLHPRMLHGAHPVMATSPCARTHCSNGPAVHALPRRRLQPGRLRSEHPGCHLRCMEGQGRGPLRAQGL